MRRVFPAALVLLGLAAEPAGAADITLLVGFPPGQGADVTAGPDASSEASQRLTSEATYEDAGRFYAERLGAFLPGAPSVAMKILPGAASLLAARKLRESPADGTVLALLGPRVVLEPLTHPRVADWRPDEFKWIGALARIDDVCVARVDADVRAIAETSLRPLFVATLAPGSRSYIYARALNELTGAKLKIISGYGSEFEAVRALETSEVQAWCGWSTNALRYRHEELLREGRVREFARFSMAPVEPGAGVASAGEAASNPDDYAAMRAVESQTRFGAFALAAPPTTSPELLATLRAAFIAMSRDPETLAVAAQRRLDVDPVPGEELQELASELGGISLAARDRLRAVLEPR